MPSLHGFRCLILKLNQYVYSYVHTAHSYLKRLAQLPETAGPDNPDAEPCCQITPIQSRNLSN